MTVQEANKILKSKRAPVDHRPLIERPTLYLIYKITHKATGKYYIGRHMTKRITDGYMGSGHQLKADLKKYGRRAFDKEVLEICDSEDALNDAEAMWVTEEAVKDPNCYNARIGGVHFVVTQDTINKILEAKTRHFGPDKTKWPNSFRGKHHSEKTKAYLREVCAMRGEDNPFYGRKHTSESIALMSAAKRGKRRSQESKDKQRRAVTGTGNPFYGRTHSEETKRRISEHRKGILHSEETKARMRASHVHLRSFTDEQILEAAQRRAAKQRWSHIMTAMNITKSISTLQHNVYAYLKTHDVVPYKEV